MAKLYFRYGAMGSSKTANALMVHYNYIEKGQKAILLKPQVENRDGDYAIRSRIGLEAECITVEDFIRYITDHWFQKGETKEPVGYNLNQGISADKNHEISITLKDIKAIIIDEAQFMSVEQVGLMATVVDQFNISVICYGLRTDFTGHLFAGSKRLMELADVIEEIPTICWCGKKAHFNARILNGQVVRDGEQIVMGGNDTYMSLCRKHYMEGKVGEENT